MSCLIIEHIANALDGIGTCRSAYICLVRTSISQGRSVRHLLDAWFLIPVCLGISSVPLIGTLLSMAASCVGMLAALRLLSYGRLVQAPGLFALYGILFFAIPLGKASLSAPTQGGPDASQAPPAAAAGAEERARNGRIPAEAAKETEDALVFGLAWDWWDNRKRRDAEGLAELYGKSVDLEGTNMSARGAAELVVREIPTDGTTERHFREAPVSRIEEGLWRLEIPYLAERRDPSGFAYREIAVFSFVARVADAKPRIILQRRTREAEVADPTFTSEGVPAEVIRLFVSSYLEADRQGDERTLSKCYAGRVTVMGKVAGNQDVLADRRAYWNRFPERFYSLKTPMRMRRLTPHRVLIEFEATFASFNKMIEGGGEESGTTEHHIVVEIADGIPAVVEQNDIVNVTTTH